MPAGPAIWLHQPCAAASVGSAIDGTAAAGVGADKLSPVMPDDGNN
jgi:hypothetical protein